MKSLIIIVLYTFVSIFSFSQNYTGSKSTNTTYLRITNVQFASINNSTTGSDADSDGDIGYDNFTEQTAIVLPGSIYSLSVTVVSGYSQNIYAWIDWNDNGDFSDANETYVVSTGSSASGVYSANITVPASAAGTKTRMRVTLKYSSIPSSTDNFTHGEVEDYSVVVDADNDGDGIFNSNDLDADNDGILDSDENTCITQDFSNGNFESNSVNPSQYIITHENNISGWETTASDNQIEIWHDNFNGVPAYEGLYFAEINANNILPQRLFQTLAVSPGDIVKWNVAHRGRAGVDRMDIMVGPTGSPVSQQIAETGTAAWKVYTSNYTVPAGVYEIEIGFEAVSTANGNKSVGNFIDDVQLYITSTTYCDSDNDGVPNIYDMDADNDGISDVVEAGGSDPDNDGMIGTGAITDINMNGVDDSVDEAFGGTPLAEPDTDNDGFVNYLDIDSDGDGIVDNIEGQSTIAYLAPLGTDVNANGWDDRYDGNASGTQIILYNSDSDGMADYVDTDSDNDGGSDYIEAYDTDMDGNANTVKRNVDSDGDGLDDNFDSDGSSATDNGGATNSNSPNSFPNDDNSTSPEKDWREPLGTLPVTLINFDATKNNNIVDIVWSTASEINNDYFLVQKSKDNRIFETIESVDGNGNSNIVINYFSADNNPNSGLNYYRLLQVDFDGSESYSNTVAVNFAGDNDIIIFPNPSTGIVNIKGANNFQLMVYNPSGELLFNTNITNTDLYNLDLSSFSKGVYIIHLISNSKTEVKRLIVQ